MIEQGSLCHHVGNDLKLRDEKCEELLKVSSPELCARIGCTEPCIVCCSKVYDSTKSLDSGVGVSDSACDSHTGEQGCSVVSFLALLDVVALLCEYTCPEASPFILSGECDLDLILITGDAVLPYDAVGKIHLERVYRMLLILVLSTCRVFTGSIVTVTVCKVCHQVSIECTGRKRPCRVVGDLPDPVVEITGVDRIDKPERSLVRSGCREETSAYNSKCIEDLIRAVSHCDLTGIHEALCIDYRKIILTGQLCHDCVHKRIAVFSVDRHCVVLLLKI